MPRPSRTQHRFLLVLLVVAIGLLALTIAPFAGALFAAVIFGTVLHGLQARLARALRDRPRVAAAALTLGLTVSVLAPLAWLTVVVVRQVSEGVATVVAIVEERGTDGLIEKLPASVQPLARRMQGWLPEDAIPRRKQGAEPVGDDRSKPQSEPQSRPASSPSAGEKPSGIESFGPVLGGAARIARGMFAGLAALLVDTAVFLVALFFLLADGNAFVGWIVATAPLPRAQSERFLRELHEVTVAVFNSTVITAALQAAVAAIGYVIVGIPQFPVALAVTLVAAFVPAIGGATVVVVISVLLMLTGSTGWGVFLAAWGLLPVALCDNIAKPYLAQEKLRMPGSIVFFAMLGGLAMFGPLGVIAGPLIVSFFLAVVRALRAGDSASHAPARTP